MAEIKNRSLSEEFLIEIDKIIDYILCNDKFVVTSHINPDGDNIGSSLAMCGFLEALDKEYIYLLDDAYPSSLVFLNREGLRKTSDQAPSLEGYTVIAQDSGSYERICMDKDLLETSRGIICIDHHHTNGDYGFINYIDAKASSTCELVYNIITRYEDIKARPIIGPEIGTCLYAGLVTDTGNFQYSNTEPSSFLMAADLIARGAKKQLVIENIYQKNSLAYYRILGECLNNLEIIDSKICIAIVTKEMLDKYGLEYGDIDAIIPYTRDIDGVELGIFIKQKEIDEIKVSLRSKSYIDCTELAAAFDGGGHVRASGCTFRNKSVEEVRNMLLEQAKKLF